MKRVICWGFGIYGQYFIDKIENYWREFQIIGVADRACDRINSEIQNKGFYFKYEWMKEKITEVYSLCEVSKLYDCHKIDGVIITVRQVQDALQIKGEIDKYNIPVISLMDNRNFRPARKIAETNYQACDGYPVYVIKNVKGSVNIWLSVVLLYDAAGSIIQESFSYFNERLMMENIVNPFPSNTDEVKKIQIEKCCVLTRCWSSINYCHYMQECMDKLWAMEECGFKGKYLLFDSEFAKEFIEILGIDLERIVWVDRQKDDILYVIKELHCVENVQGRSKKCAMVLERLSKKIISNLHLDIKGLKDYPTRLYVKRIGRRKLLEGEEILKRYGFETIIPEELTLIEQIKHFYAADIVISPHGANSTNCLYMRKGTYFIETFGRKYVFAYYLQTLALRGVHYHMLVEFGQNAYDTSMDDHSDYSLDLPLLELTLQDICKIGNFR